jgi:hypothetical protein
MLDTISHLNLLARNAEITEVRNLPCFGEVHQQANICTAKFTQLHRHRRRNYCRVTLYFLEVR